MRLVKINDPFLTTLEEDEQVRVTKGAIAQQIVIDDFKRKFPASKVKYVAPPGSQKTDIIMSLGSGNDVHIEAKVAGQRITVYDASVRRGDTNELLDWTARSLPFNKQKLSFSELIDSIRRADPRVGFPGDKGVAKSGKVPAFQVTSRPVLTALRAQLQKRYQERNDNYLALVNPTSHRVRYYYISGPMLRGLHPLKFPEINKAAFDTYGWDPKSRDALRAAIKVFVQP